MIAANRPLEKMTMSLRAHRGRSVPEETAKVARRAFRKGNAYLLIRDELEVWYEDSEFALLFSHRGQPSLSPAMLALCTVVQFAEGLSDRQMAEAVRARIDLKYLLGLELTDPGFDASVLCEFRDRLLAGQMEEKLFDNLLQRFKEKGLLKGHQQQRTDSTHVLAAVRKVNRLELVGETMRHVLNDLATVAPQWLMQHVEKEWFDRYEHRFEMARLPQEEAEREALQEQIGRDGVRLIEALREPEAPPYLSEIPSVQLLSEVWAQQYEWHEGQVRWRCKKNCPKQKT
jgi:transposase